LRLLLPFLPQAEKLSLNNYLVLDQYRGFHPGHYHRNSVGLEIPHPKSVSTQIGMLTRFMLSGYWHR